MHRFLKELYVLIIIFVVYLYNTYTFIYIYIYSIRLFEDFLHILLQFSFFQAIGLMQDGGMVNYLLLISQEIYYRDVDLLI